MPATIRAASGLLASGLRPPGVCGRLASPSVLGFNDYRQE